MTTNSGGLDEHPSPEIPSSDNEASSAPSPDPALRDQITRLVGDARELVDTEVAYNKARLAANVTVGKRVAICFVLAALLLVCAIIALILGLLLIASHWVGPAWGTLIVVGVTVAIAALIGFIGIRNVKRLPIGGDAP